MIVIKETGALYNVLSLDLIKDCVENKRSIAFVTREMRYEANEQGLGYFVDDLTQEELKAGLEAVKQTLKGQNDTLLKDYITLYTEQIGDKSEVLSVLKELKKEEIDALRDAAIESGVEYKGKIYQSAEKDRNLLTSTTSLFSITKAVPEGFKWIATDNEAVDFSLEDLISLGAKMAESVNLNTMKARELKDRVQKAKSVKELEKIGWA